MTSRVTKTEFTKLALVLVALPLVWKSAAFSIVQTLRLTNPDQALWFGPNDPVSLTEKSERIVSQKTSMAIKQQMRNVEEHAKRALQAQAIGTGALRILAWGRRPNISEPTDHRLVSLSVQTSRRDVGALLWLIEYGVAHDEIFDALKYYDLALRTNPRVGGILFPVLAKAIDDAAIRAALAPVLARRPPWLAAFLEQAIANIRSPSDIVQLMERSGGWPRRPPFLELQEGLVRQLAVKHQYQTIKRLFLTQHGHNRELLYSPSFSPASLSPSSQMIGWKLIDSPTSGALARQRGDDSVFLMLFAASTDRRVVAQKMLFLDEGKYKLSVEYGSKEPVDGARFVFSLSCLGGTAAYNLVTAGAYPTKPLLSMEVRFSVPKSCQGEILSLEIHGGEGQRTSEVLIHSITLLSEATNRKY